MLLTGPFGGLTDDVREFLRCLADEGLPLTGWGDLDQASLRTVRERLPGGGAGGDGPDGPGPGQAADQPAAVAVRRRPAQRGRRRDAAADRAGAPALARARRPAPGAGRPPPGQVELAGFAHRFRVLVGHRWPSVAAAADAGEWRQALWSTALAPLAMLGALDLPARPGRRHPQLTAPPGVPVAPRW